MFPNELTRSQKIAIAAGVTALVALIGLTIFLMIRFPLVTRAVRDISVIILALMAIVLDIILIILVWQIVKLLTYLLAELGPIVESLQETTGTVRGTATFMSDSVVNPTIELASKVAGFRESVNVLVGSVTDLRPKGGQRNTNESVGGKDG